MSRNKKALLLVMFMLGEHLDSWTSGSFQVEIKRRVRSICYIQCGGRTWFIECLLIAIYSMVMDKKDDGDESVKEMNSVALPSLERGLVT